MTSQLPRVFPTLVHPLLDAAGRAPQREALVCGAERLNYAEYLRCVAGLAQELLALGAAGGRVALVMANSIDIGIAMFAAWLARAQVVALNPIYTENELRPMLTDAEPCVVVHDAALSAPVRELFVELGIPHRIAVGAAPARRLTAWRDDASLRVPEVLPRPEDPATLHFTGGTTGRSKGASQTHHAASFNLSQREVVFPLRDDVERSLCVMPLFHCYASTMNLLAMAYRRGTVVILPKYHPNDVLDTLVRERITIFGGSPTLFAGLMNYEGFAAADFSHLYLSSSGSAPLPEEMLRRWESITGTPIIEGYGMSESGPVISFNPLHGMRKPASVGIALPEMELQVVDAETGTRVLPAGERGEIRVRGPQIMSGYRNRPAETAQALRDGWLYTGDMGELDADGYLFIRGRKKEMILVSGYNVFPREVEEVLHGISGVREAAVVGKPDAYRGELPIAFVAPQDGATLDPAELETQCRAKLAPYKVPKEFRIVAQLPKTVVGKISKLELNRQLAAEAAHE
jgi:long-chain acyl-CoA synthetase